MKLTPRLNFINVLLTAFTPVVPQSVRTQSSCQYLFTLLWPTSVKVVLRTLMKLTPGLWNILSTEYSGIWTSLLILVMVAWSYAWAASETQLTSITDESDSKIIISLHLHRFNLTPWSTLYFYSCRHIVEYHFFDKLAEGLGSEHFSCPFPMCKYVGKTKLELAKHYGGLQHHVFQKLMVKHAWK